jgi:pyruvate/2-oxoacid:ferredoxin oxidoreductase alpha subunit
MTGRIFIDGDDAAARFAYSLSEVIAIYPTTPPRPWASTPTTPTSNVRSGPPASGGAGMFR